MNFTLAPFGALQVTAQDIENGNSSKGLAGSLCDGQGKWQLRARSDNPIEVMSLIRTSNGFLTNLSRTTPSTDGASDVFFMNPGSNTSKRSFLRRVNESDQRADITISGIDDLGANAPGGDIELSLDARAATVITAGDLEDGNAELGVVGALGDGSGKWRLNITADTEIRVQSLLETDTGFLTNLSQPIE